MEEENNLSESHTEDVSSNMSSPSFSISPSFDPLASLSEKQREVLNQFRTKVQEIETSQEEKERYFNDMSLLRYLRARDYHWEKSFKMIKDTIQYRREHQPESIKISDVEVMARLGCLYVHGFDKKGRPIVIARPFKDTSSEPTIMKLRHLMFWIETGIRLMDATKGVESFTLITDYRGFSRRNLETKTNMESLNYLINHCPERMGLSLFLDPPFLFWVGWKMMSPFLSQATHNKVKFLYSTTKDGKRVFPEMAEIIDDDQLEESFGGSSTYQYDYQEMERSISNL